MRFETLSWMDVERRLGAGEDRVVLVTGACEQHAHLSLLSDISAPLAIAEAACRVEPALIAPPLPFGVSPYFAAYPGTVSLTPETFAAVVREVLASLVAQGFRRVLVLNGHGGNTGVLTPLLVETATAHPDCRFALLDWWRHPAVVAAAAAHGLPQFHANWSEAFDVNRVGPLPGGTKPPPDLAKIATAREARAVLGDGSFGGPYDAPPEALSALFKAAVTATVAALRALARAV
jgi:creatinine amidohydrolase